MPETRPPLRRVVIAIDASDERRQALRDEFAHIDFVFTDNDHLREAIAGAQAVLGWSRMDDLLVGADELVWVQNVGAGVEGVVTEAFQKRGLILTNGSGVMAPNIAEHVVGMMLALARQFPQLLDAQRRRRWKGDVSMSSVRELGGQTALLVGVGEIGRQIARRLVAFDMTIIGVRRSGGPATEHIAEVGTLDALPAFASRADHIVSSLPHTAETAGLFDARFFSVVRKGACFYNVGRGTSVVQTDLIVALESGRLGGAGLDVTDPEPLPQDDPLWTAPNAIITAHTSGASPRFQDRLFELFTDNLRRYERGSELRNVVDQARGY